MTNVSPLLTLAAVAGAVAALLAGSSTLGIAFLVVALAGAGWALITSRSDRRALTELQHADEALRASESKFAGILSIAADAIITVDGLQRILHFNWGAEQIFGYTEAEVIGEPLNILLPARFRPTHASYVEGFANAPETARRMGHRREIFGLRKSGEEFPAEASISKLATRDNVVFTVVLRDVTDRKRVEQEQRFLAGASALLSSSLDMDETLASIAEVARPMLADACLVEIPGDGSEARWIVSGHDDDTVETELRRIGSELPYRTSLFAPRGVALQGPKAYVAFDDREAEGRAATPREQEFTRRLDARTVVVVPMTLGERALGRILLVATGERYLNQSDLALASELGSRCASALESARLYEAAQRATSARDEVLAVVSHDLRNPISAIAMCARVLTESPPDDPAERARMLGAISQATDWTNRLIQDLLDVASIEAGKLSMERSHETVETLVQTSLAMFATEVAQKGQQLTVDVAPDLRPLQADASRVVQALTNLIGNALKFTPASGRIIVSAKENDGGVEFAVQDNGPGIPAEERALIFERFWHTRRGARRRGSGLGLAIAKGIVDAHGGRIWVDSADGGGSIFRFTIPRK